ncbi:hypothetical protein ACGFYQ_38940 [Streptomyces sp. NPDC048258]|uniref:hypothetical protein n=1 Tax=Streptomyces sp. NPDC048258 TaxID=3365527 RepID=UPI003720E4E1
MALPDEIYRPDGHLTAIDDALAGLRTFTLDRVACATSVDAANWSERYAYDDAGNQTSATWPTRHPGAEACGERYDVGPQQERLIGKAGPAAQVGGPVGCWRASASCSMWSWRPLTAAMKTASEDATTLLVQAASPLDGQGLPAGYGHMEVKDLSPMFAAFRPGLARGW